MSRINPIIIINAGAAIILLITIMSCITISNDKHNVETVKQVDEPTLTLVLNVKRGHQYTISVDDDNNVVIKNDVPIQCSGDK